MNSPERDLVLAARLQRKLELKRQLEALCQGRLMEPQDGEAFAEWSRRMEAIQRELRLLGEH